MAADTPRPGGPEPERVDIPAALAGAAERIAAAEGYLDKEALVARRADRLEAVAADCRTTAPGSRWWSADLADPAAAGTPVPSPPPPPTKAQKKAAKAAAKAEAKTEAKTKAKTKKGCRPCFAPPRR